MMRGGPVRWLQRGLAVGAVVCVLMGLLTVRVYRGAASAMERSDEAFNHGSLQVALEEAHQAALWYSPFSPHQDRSYERLRAIAIGAESEGNTGLAQRAWEAVRGALLATAHPVPLGETHRTKRLVEANAQLARLLADSAPDAPPELKAELLLSYEASQTPTTERVLARSAGMLVILLTGLGLVLTERVHVRRVFYAPLSLGVLLWFFSALGA